MDLRPVVLRPTTPSGKRSKPARDAFSGTSLHNTSFREPRQHTGLANTSRTLLGCSVALRRDRLTCLTVVTLDASRCSALRTRPSPRSLLSPPLLRSDTQAYPLLSIPTGAATSFDSLQGALVIVSRQEALARSFGAGDGVTTRHDQNLARSPSRYRPPPLQLLALVEERWMAYRLCERPLSVEFLSVLDFSRGKHGLLRGRDRPRLACAGKPLSLPSCPYPPPCLVSTLPSTARPSAGLSSQTLQLAPSPRAEPSGKSFSPATPALSPAPLVSPVQLDSPVFSPRSSSSPTSSLDVP